jgi:hypothetical protein
MGTQLQLPSQSECKPYGHLICTPMCVLVGVRYVNGEFDQLTDREVRLLLGVAHRLYSDRFSKEGLPMKLHDLLPLLPPEGLECTEAAGMILKPSTGDPKCTGLVVGPLLELLVGMSQRARHDGARRCLLATAQEHTVCYWADEQGSLSVFDPLPAYVRAIPHSELRGWLHARYCASAAEEPLYSGLCLVRLPQSEL